MNSFLGLLVGQLPRAITPTIAGLAVGAFVGVVGFLAVMLLVGRGQRRPEPRGHRPVVHVVPPYQAFQRVTPLPPNAFSMPSPQIRVAPLPFTPSTALSARALAKMYGGEESAAYMALPEEDAIAHLPQLIVPVGLERPEPPPSEPAPESIPISISPIVILDKEEPHPLSIIPTGSSVMKPTELPKRASSRPSPPAPPPSTITRTAPPSPSAVMRAASFDDFDVDEGATEIAETVFDEPPRRRSRSEPPKIRAVSPSGPRFPAAPCAPSPSSVSLPAVTPPPTRVATRHHS